MLLSSYERADSPFLWIQYAATPGGKVRYHKTRILKSDPDKKIKIARERNRVESRLLADDPHCSNSWAWVPNYLRQRYASRPATSNQYRIRWSWMAKYFLHASIRSPAALERDHCFDYIEWRRAQVKEKSGRNPKLNTALSELKLLGLVMAEAITRGFAADNPARKLGIEREESDDKPPMMDDEIAIIYRELKNEAVWMQRAFHIALHTGLRHAETQIRREAIRLERKEIDVGRPKGGRKKAFTIPLSAGIADMITEFIATQKPFLWETPGHQLTGLAWTKFFRRIGLPHLNFHATRRTFITRGALAKPPIPEAMMMKLVNHASKEVHRIYQKYASADLYAVAARIEIPGPPE